MQKFLTLFIVMFITCDFKLMCIDESYYFIHLDAWNEEDDIDKNIYPELAKFIANYKCSSDLEYRVQKSIFYKKYIEKHIEQYIEKNNEQSLGRHSFRSGTGLLWNKPSLEFFIKGPEIDRIINAQRMQKYFERNKLDCFRVPEKKISFKDGMLCVISKKINVGDQKQKISLKEIQQLVKIAFDTGYWDWQFGNNVLRDSDGKLVFVDTENISYVSPPVFKILSALVLTFYFNDMDEQAQAWLLEQIGILSAMGYVITHLYAYSFNQLTPSLPVDRQYDEEFDIDFEKVKKEFEEFVKSHMKQIVDHY